MSFDEFFNNYYVMSFGGGCLHPPILCADGFTVSVQASEYHYCSPRVTGISSYVSYELGFPSIPDELIYEYAEDGEDLTGTVYGYVPRKIVIALIEKHGGLVIDENVLKEFANRNRCSINVLSNGLKEYINE